MLEEARGEALRREREGKKGRKEERRLKGEREREKEKKKRGRGRKGIGGRSMEGGTRRNLVVEKSKIDHVVHTTDTRTQVSRKERGKR